MTAELLLDRLDGVQARGEGRWMAKCPAHEDRRPSLSIRAVDDRLLIHCFAACTPGDVLAAVGLTLSDLFPAPLDHHLLPARDYRHVHAAREALKTLAHESLVALLAARTVAAGMHLSVSDMERLGEAVERIARAREAAA